MRYRYFQFNVILDDYILKLNNTLTKALVYVGLRPLTTQEWWEQISKKKKKPNFVLRIEDFDPLHLFGNLWNTINFRTLTFDSVFEQGNLDFAI